ncbi:hypothetical protein ACSFA2_14515 [Variovorax sp. LT2P21]|uniref:hypothetical protein n=1 Tax=Variovorax sp. LT2P21 TaxID=3443731 RepID=UPI003F47F135
MTRHRLATLGLFISLSLGATASAAADAGARPGARNTTWMTVGDDTLAAMRGGFDLGGGVMVSFGISRVVTVNGVVLSSTSFQLPDLGRITAAQIAAFERYLGSTSVVQVGSGNTAPMTPTTPTADGGTSVASSSGGTGGSAASGNAGTSGSPATAGSATTTFSSPATVVQNTLNNQSIQTRTVIDATTNALSLARGANTAAALRDALTRAVPGR